MTDGIEASERMVDDWTRRVQQQAERYQAMAERVEGISVTERSADRNIEVTINSKGLLTDLSISEAAQGKRMGEVSALIMRTVQAAQARIPELLREAMAETVGTQDQTVNKVFEDASKTFPEPPEDDPTAPPPPADHQLDFGPVDDEPAPPQTSQTSQPPPPSRPQARPRRRTEDDDDDDFGGRSILN